ncbi:MAG: hypothetical protein EPO02_09975 [Nitrospirae bacterium]|nr:MAG: hypothetical protein EPO02_09975 [Nitrospirota bacterium]
MNEPVAAQESPGLRRWNGAFLLVVVPIVNAIGGFFTLDFLLSGQYTWGRTLRTFVLSLSLLVLAYEFVYRDLQASHPEWTERRLLKRVLGHAIIPFFGGMALLLLLLAVTRLLK